MLLANLVFNATLLYQFLGVIEQPKAKVSWIWYKIVAWRTSFLSFLCNYGCSIHLVRLLYIKILTILQQNELYY
jgi:hypothetical protein